jgi:hypothetical protein
MDDIGLGSWKNEKCILRSMEKGWMHAETREEV